jgi:hypothetical protein
MVKPNIHFTHLAVGPGIIGNQLDLLPLQHIDPIQEIGTELSFKSGIWANLYLQNICVIVGFLRTIYKN